MHHEYTWETLFHFNCGECSNWWSYAGVLENNQLRSPTMTCPHCGYKTKIKLKEGSVLNGEAEHVASPSRAAQLTTDHQLMRRD